MTSPARIETPFTRESTAGEVIAGVDLAGKRAVITGGASGIGVETARALAAAGAEVTLAVRDVEAGARVAAGIAPGTGAGSVRAAPLELTDRASVAAFASAWRGPLHVLVNNAGIMALPELRRTREGWEMQLATNHVGHFALANGLRPALAAAGGARIVAVSSSAHLFSPVVFDDLHFDFAPYEPLAAYARSKTAVVLFAVGATSRWADDGITANAVMPGAIATRLQRHTGGLRTPVERRKTPQQGAATPVLAAASPLLEGVGGRYFEDASEAPVVASRGPDLAGVAPYALDPASACGVPRWSSCRGRGGAGEPAAPASPIRGVEGLPPTG
ncbi:MAG TPA: SDR family NAD(P)-dependent oxidoreductase [Longimicrobiaceae bacterium]|jgi:NAD(P)-dependent dehydrogenase (short-subunit alcohol dehydrogenase family)